MEKICNRCLVKKPFECFDFKNKKAGKRQSHCKTCRQVYSRTHYQNNKRIYINRSFANKNKRYLRIRTFLNDLRKECIMCNENHESVLDFHHLNSSKKDYSIARLVSMKKISREIQKCIVLCSNCHRKYHWGKRQKNKHKLSEDIVQLVETIDSKSIK